MAEHTGQQYLLDKVRDTYRRCIRNRRSVSRMYPSLHNAVQCEEVDRCSKANGENAETHMLYELSARHDTEAKYGGNGD
jgi:hypothetical protein